MKVLIRSMIILGIISMTPALAEKPAGSGTGPSASGQTDTYGKAMQQSAGKGDKAQKQYQEKMQHKAKEGQGEMHQERHRELEKHQAGKETGKGTAQGEPKGSGQGKKWWKFWE